MNALLPPVAGVALLLAGGMCPARADAGNPMERKGSELAARLRSLQPVEGVTNHATLRIRTRAGAVQLPLRVEVEVTPGGWITRYTAAPPDAPPRTLVITFAPGAPNRYEWIVEGGRRPLDAAELFAPFAGSDFQPADLGMEFLHWPVQRLLKKEIRRGQSCYKLESLAPPGHTNGYARVVSWFDIDTGGPVLCEAYDADGRLVKEFKPNSFSKVDGRWQVEELEMWNRRTGSRSFLQFNLKPDSGVQHRDDAPPAGTPVPALQPPPPANPQETRPF